MSEVKQYKPGAILKSEVGQFAKIISVRNGVYGISDWSTKKNAEKATVANKFINAYGLKYANCTVEKSAQAGKAKAPAKSSTKQAAPKKAPAKKTARKTAAKAK